MSVLNFEWPQWLIMCDCLTEDGKPYRCRESCESCALERAAHHLALGHHPHLTPPGPVR